MKADLTRAKKNRRLFSRDNLAAVGIGTMIVFIATILVAATAAAVLIDTSGKLQEKSQKTGTETTKEVASNLIIKGIYGKRNTAAATVLTSLNVTVALAPGAESVDLSEMIVRMSDGSTVKEMDHSAADAADTNFVVAELRDDDSSFSAAAPVMTPGDLINVQINLTHQSMTLAVRKDVDLTLIPEVGAQVIGDFTTPASFGTDTIVVLR